MGRNRAGQTSYEAIVDAAIAAFGQVGFDGVSIRAIGARAGVTVGAVHHHFNGKDHLYDTCVAVADRRLRERLFADLLKLPRDGDLSALLRDAIAVGLRFVRSHIALIRFLQRSYVEQRARVTPSRVRRQEDVFGRLVQILAARSGNDEASIRVACKALQFALVRFATSSDEELLFITGGTTLTEAFAAVERTLHSMAVTTLLKPIERARPAGAVRTRSG